MQGQSQLHDQFKTSLGYTRPCLKGKQTANKQRKRARELACTALPQTHTKWLTASSHSSSRENFLGSLHSCAPPPPYTYTYFKTKSFFLKALKMEPSNSTLPVWESIPPKLKAGFQRALCTPMFREALFSIAKIWKQPKNPKADGWTNTLGSTHMMG